MTSTKPMASVVADLTPTRMGPFQPCDISDLFDEISPGVFTARSGAAYQILDQKLNFQVAWGSPTIWYGKYAEGGFQEIQGPPHAAYVAHNLYYPVIFPEGLTIIHRSIDTTKQFYHSSKPQILALRKDRIIDGKINRDIPRPLQMAPGIYLPI